MRNDLNIFLSFITISFLFISIVYSSFNTELMINGIAHLRIPAEVRITDFKVIEKTESAYEVYSSEYSKDSTSTYVALPTIGSTITYQFTITNTSDKDYDISDIIIESDTNSNIKYELEANSEDVISANSAKTYTLKLLYDGTSLPPDMTDTLIIRYEFVEHVESYVVAIYNQAKSYTFTAPSDGTYKIELWGARGSLVDISSSVAGYGAYTSGNIYLKANTVLYFYIGGQGYEMYDSTLFNSGTSNDGGWNGGGATDVRLVNGSWNNITSLRSRIMVAAGGGVGYSGAKVGAGGGLTGYNGGGSSGGTQISFPKSQLSHYTASSFGVSNGGCSGGNGYYPSAAALCTGGSGGGSSFISGHTGCVAVTSASSTNPRTGTDGQTCTTGIDDNLCSQHYSGYIFSKTKMIDGQGYNWSNEIGDYVGMPTFDGTGTMVGNNTSGYAKVTYIGG